MCKKNFPIWDFKKTKILGFHQDEFAHLIICFSYCTNCRIFSCRNKMNVIRLLSGYWLNFVCHSQEKLKIFLEYYCVITTSYWMTKRLEILLLSQHMLIFLLFSFVLWYPFRLVITQTTFGNSLSVFCFTSMTLNIKLMGII